MRLSMFKIVQMFSVQSEKKWSQNCKSPVCFLSLWYIYICRWVSWWDRVAFNKGIWL